MGKARDGNKSWYSMCQRCHNPLDKDYKWYGARGIKVCDRWRLSFSAFLEDMGPRSPDKPTIDRIDRNGGYEPGNCKWASWTEQARNRSNNKLEDHEADQIRWLRSLGYSQTEIGRFFEVTQSHVSRICSGEVRKADSV